MVNLAATNSTPRAPAEGSPIYALTLAESAASTWLDTRQYPFAARSFDHAEGSIHYVEEGRGSPLLFIHGTPSWSFEWRAAIGHFRDRYRCLALDHLGFGLSEKPPSGAYLPSDHTRRLHDFIRALDLRDITLVVHDFGGPIALPLVVRDPSRFRRVVVVNTWAWPTDSESKGRLLMRMVRSPLGRFLYLFCNASPRWLLPASFAKRTALSHATHRHYLAPFPNRATRLSLWTLGANLVDSRAFAPELPAVVAALRELPTALVWGKRDAIIGEAVLSQWRQLLPAAPTFELADAGHFPQEETPTDFLRALDAIVAD
jgi:pimeloyl-ACP methyl ester carboxylesterase